MSGLPAVAADRSVSVLHCRGRGWSRGPFCRNDSMRYVLIIAGVIVGLVVLAFVLLVVNFVVASRRQRKRAQQKLAAVMEPIAAGQEPNPVVVRQLAAQPETRNALYEALVETGKQHLFP